MTRAHLIFASFGLLFACASKGTNDDLAGDTDSESTATDSTGSADGTGDGTDDADGTGDADDDATGDGDGDDATGDGTGDGDCELGEYIPTYPSPDPTTSAGYVYHSVELSTLQSIHLVNAAFFTSDWVDDSLLCVEPIAEADGVDSCEVWYTQGFGVGGEAPEDWFQNIAATDVSLDIGEGPVALTENPATNSYPAWWDRVLSEPAVDVPFGEVVTFAASFDDWPAIELDMTFPNDLAPTSPAFDATELSAAEISTWTWSGTGGSEPVRIEVTFGPTPAGTGWSERVRVSCTANDDGSFEIPIGYVAEAYERLGPELFVSAAIARKNEGEVPFAGKFLQWDAMAAVSIAAAIVR